MATVETEEADHATLRLEQGDVGVEVHAVDALDIQGDVLVGPTVVGSWWAPGAGGLAGQLTASTVL